MQGIGSTSDGKTKNSKEDSEAVQKWTAESPAPIGWRGRGRGSRWKLSVGAGEQGTA